MLKKNIPVFITPLWKKIMVQCSFGCQKVLLRKNLHCIMTTIIKFVNIDKFIPNELCRTEKLVNNRKKNFPKSRLGAWCCYLDFFKNWQTQWSTLKGGQKRKTSSDEITINHISKSKERLINTSEKRRKHGSDSDSSKSDSDHVKNSPQVLYSKKRELIKDRIETS